MSKVIKIFTAGDMGHRVTRVPSDQQKKNSPPKCSSVLYVFYVSQVAKYWRWSMGNVVIHEGHEINIGYILEIRCRIQCILKLLENRQGVDITVR